MERGLSSFRSLYACPSHACGCCARLWALIPLIMSDERSGHRWLRLPPYGLARKMRSCEGGGGGGQAQGAVRARSGTAERGRARKAAWAPGREAMGNQAESGVGAVMEQKGCSPRAACPAAGRSYEQS